MESASIVTETAKSAIIRYPDDLDIVVYDDGRWRYAASYPDDLGSFREVYLHHMGGENWGMRIYEQVGVPDIQGMTKPRWETGMSIESDRSGAMSYETARGVAEVWLRGGRIFGVA